MEHKEPQACAVGLLRPYLPRCKVRVQRKKRLRNATFSPKKDWLCLQNQILVYKILSKNLILSLHIWLMQKKRILVCKILCCARNTLDIFRQPSTGKQNEENHLKKKKNIPFIRRRRIYPLANLIDLSIRIRSYISKGRSAHVHGQGCCLPFKDSRS